mgnify:CR=1 FL=1
MVGQVCTAEGKITVGGEEELVIRNAVESEVGALQSELGHSVILKPQTAKRLSLMDEYRGVAFIMKIVIRIQEVQRGSG